MKYILFYFIAASHQFILLQPSVQVQHFHARLAGGRDLSCLSPINTNKRGTGMLTRTARFM